MTGEAVVLELRVARPATRGLGYGLDLLVEAAAFAVLLIPLTRVLAGASPSLTRGLTLAITVLIFVGYPLAIETLTRGKSVGKYAMGLRVVRDDGGPVRFRHALVRALSGIFVDFFVTLGVAGFCTAMLSRRGKRVGDLLAGTVVLRDRAPSSPRAARRPASGSATGSAPGPAPRSATGPVPGPEQPPGPPMPQPLESWARGLELSRLPDRLADGARTYLRRYDELTPAARDSLGARLADEVSTHIAPPPPPGTPAWAYLAAVLAERRRRALDRGEHPGS